MELSKRKIKKLLVTAYTHGLNEMWRKGFYEWFDEQMAKIEKEEKKSK